VAVLLNPPPVKVTLPVGVWPVPVTLIPTEIGVSDEKVVFDAVTATVGVGFAFTVTVAVPVAPLKLVSPEYVAVSVSVPTESAVPGILMVAAPFARVVAVPLYPPPESVTVPVGVCVPPETLMATETAVPVVTVVGVGVTVTVGVVFWEVWGFCGVPPPPPQPTAVNVAAVRTRTRPSILRPRRKPSGAQKIRNAARAVPPAARNQAVPEVPVRAAVAAAVPTVTVPS